MNDKKLQIQDNTDATRQAFNDTISELINGWLQSSAGMPITLSMTDLGLRIYGAMNTAFALGQDAGSGFPIAQRPGDMRVMPALLLDLDGTIRRSKGGHKFIQGSDDIDLFADVEATIWQYKKRHNAYVAGVTNQGGVAYGIRTPEQISDEIRVTMELFDDCPFDAVKGCYNHPDGKIFPFNYRSLSRKPDIGLLALLETDAFNKGIVIDWDKSLMVGDREEDQILARNAGIKFQWADDFFQREGSAE